MTYTVSSTPSKSPKGYLSKRQLSNSLRWLIYVIKSVDNTKLPCYSPTDAAPKFLLKLTPFNPGLGRFTIFYSAICLGRSCHPVNQSHARLKPVSTSSLPFTSASGSLLVILPCVVYLIRIGSVDYFGLGGTSLSRITLCTKCFMLPVQLLFLLPV